MGCSITPTPKDGPDLLKSHEVCALGRIAVATLNRYVRDGKLRPTYLSARARRFRRDEVRKFFGLRDDDPPRE